MTTRKLTDIHGGSVIRMTCGSGEIDAIMGRDGEHGLAIGKITYLSGEPGVGKSRLCIQLCKALNEMGHTILYFQGEVPLDDFSSWFGTAPNPDKIICSDDKDPDAIICQIRSHRPTFVVVDSANMIKGFMRIAEDNNEFFDQLRSILKEVNGHCLLLGQITKDGKTAGPNRVPHMIDTDCKLVLLKNAKWIREMGWNKAQRDAHVLDINRIYGKTIVWEVGKNRYGPDGGWVRFYHNDAGVHILDNSFMVAAALRGKGQKSKEVAPSGRFFAKLGRWFSS